MSRQTSKILLKPSSQREHSEQYGIKKCLVTSITNYLNLWICKTSARYLDTKHEQKIYSLNIPYSFSTIQGRNKNMDSCDKLVFRLQHLIPHGLSSAAPKITNNNIIPLQGPAEPNNYCVSSKTFEEVTFSMTYGKVAGKMIRHLIDFQ